MKKKGVLTWTELRVGLLFIASLVILAFTIVYVGSGGGSPFARKYDLRALMTDVNGLKAGAPVRLGGVEVGTVIKVAFAPEGGLVEVRMRLDRSVKGRITSESHVSLGSMGLLGEKAVDIEPSAEGTPVQDGGYVSGAAEDPFKGLLTNASASTAHLRRVLSRMDAGEGLLGRALRDEELYERMVDVSQRLQNVMSKLEGQTSPLGRLVNDREMSQRLSSSAHSLDSVLSRVEAGKGALGRLTADEELSTDLKALTRSLREVAEHLGQGQGTAGRLIKEGALYDRIEAVSTRLDAVVSRLERGEGTAGRLLHDTELYENLNAAAKDVRSLAGDIRRDPRKYLRLKLSLF
jgi:phospholipid/cholesterol/gamma-HCH transport system substrate-binding protein